MKRIRAHWWFGCNFGDMLTPYLVEHLSGTKAVWVERNSPGTVFMVTGSMIEQAFPGAHIWGCGIMYPASRLPSPLVVHAVRGRLTRDALRRSGNECPEVFGDPALLLPRIYSPIVEKKYNLGIVPHFKDLDRACEFYGDDTGVHIIDVTDGVEQVLQDILSCERIASSSLHGIIAADAYGIPSRWVEFSDKVDGREVKFRDYWSGVQIAPETPMDVRKRVDVRELANGTRLREPRFDAEQFMKSCPFLTGTSSVGQ
jgi:pyruvyltransferase